MVDMDSNENELLMHIPKKKSVAFLILISIITLMFYPFFWYLERTSELNNLKTKSKVGKAIPVSMILIFIIILGLISGGIIYIQLKDALPTNITSFYDLTWEIKLIVYIVAIALIMNLLLIIASAFKVRKILNEAIANKDEKIKLSGFSTLIFNFMYLQYEINRITDDNEDKQRKAPWIMLVISLALIAGISYLVYYLLNVTA